MRGGQRLPHPGLGQDQAPRPPLAPVRAFIWEQLRERERRIVRGPRAPAKPAFLSGRRRRHCHFHYVLRFIPPHSTHPQKHIRYAAASLQICRSGISSRFFLLTSAFPLCFSFVLAVFHIPYLCNMLRCRTTLHYTRFSSPLISDL